MSSITLVNNEETDSDLVYALRQRIRDLETIIGVHWQAPRVLNLTRSEERVLGVITARPVVSHAALYDALYSLRLNPPDPMIVKAFIFRVRRKMAPHEITIDLRWGFGYEITPDNLARLNALYAPGEQTGAAT